MVGFEPTSDTSRPKEGSRSMSSTTGEGRQTRLQLMTTRKQRSITSTIAYIYAHTINLVHTDISTNSKLSQQVDAILSKEL